MMLNSRTYAIRGGLVALMLSIASGILLPVTFLLCATDHALRMNLLLPVCAIVILVKCFFAVPIGSWMGWNIGEKAAADPSFAFMVFVRDLVGGFFRQRAYRVITSVAFLFIVAGVSYSAYLRLTGKAACLDSRVVNGQVQCLRRSLIFSQY